VDRDERYEPVILLLMAGCESRHGASESGATDQAATIEDPCVATDEIVGDHLDQDCDGGDGFLSSTGGSLIHDGNVYDTLGQTVALADLDANGTVEVITNALSMFWEEHDDTPSVVLLGPAFEGEVRLDGDFRNDAILVGAPGDVTGDGVIDLIVGLHDGGSEILVYSSSPENGFLQDGQFRLEDFRGTYGQDTVVLNDRWLVVPNYLDLVNERGVSSVQLVPLPVEPGVSLLSPEIPSWEGLAPYDSTGFEMNHLDLGSDGVEDLVIAGQDSVVDGVELAGRVWLAGDPGFAGRSLTEADVAWTGTRERAFLGAATAVGDFDGDGADDLAVGSPGDPLYDFEVGAVHVLLAPFTAGAIDAVATRTIEGDGKADFFGGSLASVPDLDGDGADELVVGAPGNYYFALRKGRVDVFASPVADASTPLDAVIRWGGEHVTDRFGNAVAVGDTMGDSLPELYVSARQHDAGGEDAGRLYLLPLTW
jgi:hypothetical protein